MDQEKTGTLYIVATPIGNLADISRRACQVLADVSLVAAEDTRHSRRLLAHLGIDTPLFALHDHNERAASDRLLARLQRGDDVALISDAGTPLISDPGFVLVRAARQHAVRVVPVPGPSALVTALSVAGLPVDRFCFEGFLPARSAARRERLARLAAADATLVFYEASHRISESLADMADCLGSERRAVVARELTKTFETVQDGTLQSLYRWVEADSHRQKGEFVVLVQGVEAQRGELDRQAQHTLEVLAGELPLKQAATLAASITGAARNLLYRYGLSLRNTE